MRTLMLLLLILPAIAFAEDDGEEYLRLMEDPRTRDVALVYLDNVTGEWDGRLFCFARGRSNAPDDARSAAFTAVKTYLEQHPQDRYRPRRYLIIQGLRAAFPCPAS